MVLKSVAVSGTVGKQTFATTQLAVLHGFAFTPSGANATLTIRDGNASGDVVLFARATSANGTIFNNHGPVKFDKGMHVKVIGSNAVCYLYIE